MPIQYDANGIITQNLTEILDERANNLKSIMAEDFVIDKTTPIGNMELADANSELTIQELIAWLKWAARGRILVLKVSHQNHI